MMLLFNHGNKIHSVQDIMASVDSLTALVADGKQVIGTVYNNCNSNTPSFGRIVHKGELLVCGACFLIPVYRKVPVLSRTLCLHIQPPGFPWSVLMFAITARVLTHSALCLTNILLIAGTSLFWTVYSRKLSNTSSSESVSYGTEAGSERTPRSTSAWSMSSGRNTMPTFSTMYSIRKA